MTSAKRPPTTLQEIFARKEKGREANRTLSPFVKMEMAIQMYRDRQALVGKNRPADQKQPAQPLPGKPS